MGNAYLPNYSFCVYFLLADELHFFMLMINSEEANLGLPWFITLIKTRATSAQGNENRVTLPMGRATADLIGQEESYKAISCSSLSFRLRYNTLQILLHQTL